MKNTILKSYLKKILRSEAFVSVIIVFVLALGIIGTSYALYMDVDTDTDYQLVEVGDLRIDFDHNENSDNPNDYNKIDLENVTPSEDDIAITQADNIFSFRIYNTGTYDVDYKIKLVTADGNDIDTQYINYQICKDNATCNNINTLSNSNDSVIRTGQIKTIDESEANSDYYFLRVWINNEYPEDRWDDGESLVLRVMIEASNISERTLVYKILENAQSGIEGRSVFTEPDDLPTAPAVYPSGVNERILSYTEDDLGISYYFRGSVNDNYVNFAGMCWRIVRIAGDGSVKLILEDQSAECNSTSFSKKWNIGYGNFGYELKNVNVTLTPESVISYLNPVTAKETSMVQRYYNFQKTLAQKLNTELTESSSVSELNQTLNTKLKSGDWCLGTDAYVATNVNQFVYEYSKLNEYDYEQDMYYDSFVRLRGFNKDGYLPTLKCNGKILNEFLDVEGISSKSPMYVSAITADEVVYAGGMTNKHVTSYYLYLGDDGDFRILSPAHYTPDSTESVFIVDEYGELIIKDVEYPYGIRPSISLRTGITYVAGDGTMDNPYVID